MDPKNEKRDNLDFELKPLRTYEDDVKSAVQNDNISTTKIVMAEQKKRDTLKQKQIFTQASPARVEVSQKKPMNKKVLALFVSVILFALGGAAIYYTSGSFNMGTTRQPIVLDQIDFINTDKSIIINSQGKQTRQILGEVRQIIKNNSEGQGGDIIDLVITKVVSKDTIDGTTTELHKLSSRDIFTLMSSLAPDSLIRSLNGAAMIGFNKQAKLEPFIILKSDDIDQTYAGMLLWERNMVRDLRDLFFENLGSGQAFIADAPNTQNKNIDDDFYIIRTAPTENTSTEAATSTDTGTSTEAAAAETSTSTATTTEPEVEIAPVAVVEKELPTYDPYNFVDLVISNKDARGIVNSEGKILFFYSLVDNEHIVITTNKETLNAVLGRLNVSNLIR